MAAATTNSSRTRTDLAGRTVVITGASSGFGKGVARRLAEQGARLVLVARRTDLIEALAKECGDAIAVTADVGNAIEVERVANAALVQYGGFDAWINDAGVAALGYFDEIPLEDHHRVVPAPRAPTVRPRGAPTSATSAPCSVTAPSGSPSPANPGRCCRS